MNSPKDFLPVALLYFLHPISNKHTHTHWHGYYRKENEWAVCESDRKSAQRRKG